MGVRTGLDFNIFFFCEEVQNITSLWEQQSISVSNNLHTQKIIQEPKIHNRESFSKNFQELIDNGIIILYEY